ncbi:MAG: glycosyl hydrolase 53 family protein [Alicyclobacillus sp.]|nr:glycosyl hydrolase 53 family protein [Alicyclobacillus sp.]
MKKTLTKPVKRVAAAVMAVAAATTVGGGWSTEWMPNAYAAPPATTAAHPGTPAANAVWVQPVPALEHGQRPNFIMGADVSELYALEQAQKQFYNTNGVQENCLKILKQHGVNWIRIRLWNDPTNSLGQPLGGGNNDLATDIAIAKQAKVLGMKILLDFQYSDFWADPGKQNKPKAWATDHGAALQKDIYDFTYRTLTTMKNQGVLPSMVQLGNEINAGILWPDGNSAVKAAPFLQAAAAAVRKADPHADNPSKKIQIMLHLAGSSDGSVGNFTSDLDTWTTGNTKVDFDVIGISYYPYYHGTVAQDANILDTLAARYHKPVVVAETSEGWTVAQGDETINTFNQQTAYTAGYTPTPEGQAAEIRDVINNVANVPNDMGLGVFYWGADWLPGDETGWESGAGSSWENQALFDFNGRALPSLDVFREVRHAGPTPPANFVSADPVYVKTSVGTPPILPSQVEGEYSDGHYREVSVTSWNTSGADLSKPGVYTIHGQIGTNSTAATAVVTVNPAQPPNLVQNAGLENGSSGWTSSNPAVATPSTSGTAHNGSGEIHYWSATAFQNARVFQTITNVPNGTYTLSVWAEGSSTSGASQIPYLYATGFNASNPSEVQQQSLQQYGWNIWKQYTMQVTVTSGQVTIGVNCNGDAGAWGDVDDFYFGLPPVSDTATQTQAVSATGPDGQALGTSQIVPYRVPYVTLSSPTPGATIYYTTDGSDPTTSSTTEVYTGPLSLTRNTELKAYAIAPGYRGSLVTSYDFTVDEAQDSNLVPNGGFDTAASLGPWRLSGVPEGGDGSSYVFDATDSATPGIVYAGNGAFQYWSAKPYQFTLSQTVTGLPNGVYTLSVESAGANNSILQPDGRATNDASKATLTLSAETTSTSESVNMINEGTNTNGWNQWNRFEVPNIVVRDGVCSISFTVDASAGYWGYLDHVSLVRTGTVSPNTDR